MKIYILLILLLCLTYYSKAAFPIACQSSAYTAGDTTHTPLIPRPETVGKKTFAAFSGYGFLLSCAAILVVSASDIVGGFDLGPIWIQGATIVAGLSGLLALIGVIRGEGSRARIMLFLSVFFFLLLLIFK